MKKSGNKVYYLHFITILVLLVGFSLTGCNYSGESIVQEDSKKEQISETYSVLFTDYDGRVISEKTYDISSGFTIPNDPKRIDYDSDCVYTFTGWEPKIDRTCRSDQIYVATYSAKSYERIKDDLEAEEFEKEIQKEKSKQSNIGRASTNSNYSDKEIEEFERKMEEKFDEAQKELESQAMQEQMAREAEKALDEAADRAYEAAMDAYIEEAADAAYEKLMEEAADQWMDY